MLGTAVLGCNPRVEEAEKGGLWALPASPMFSELSEKSCFKILGGGDGEMTWHLTALAALVDDQGSVLDIHLKAHN